MKMSSSIFFPASKAGLRNLTLTAYPSGREGLYSIPESVQGRTVDRIWSGAFKNAEKLTDIEIPENVKIIGGNAFEHSGLTDVTVPDTVVAGFRGV